MKEKKCWMSFSPLPYTNGVFTLKSFSQKCSMENDLVITAMPHSQVMHFQNADLKRATQFAITAHGTSVFVKTISNHFMNKRPLSVAPYNDDLRSLTL
jgi:hypothetical protein